MRVLLDECLPRNLAGLLSGHEVKTVPQMGWASIENGRLLALAEKSFDVFVTIDKKLPQQQDLPRFKIGIVVLVCRSNRLPDLVPLVPKLLASLSAIKKGKALRIG
jgi:hypothetical protein